MNLPTRDHLTEPAVTEPQNETDCTCAEARLIERLRLQQCLTPRDFVLDHAVGPYKLRLYCPDARLAVEVVSCDPLPLPRGGGSGSGSQAVLERADALALRRSARDSFLQSLGIEVLRVAENEIDSNDELEALVARIALRIERRMRAQRESAGRKRLTISARELSPGGSFA